VYNVIVGKPEEKRPLRRPRCRWEDGIRMNLGETGFVHVRTRMCVYIMDSPGSGQEPLTSCHKCSDEPLDSGTT
jgi:hypothetical protein